VSLPSMAQFRTTRHIIGEYVMTGEDVYKTFEDSVGTFGDFFVRHRGMWYEIPYRSLYNGSFPNMLSSGRIISASGEAWKATRVIPVAALTGEISGVAAAIAIRENCEVSKVDLHTLRGKLVEKNNIVRH